MNDLPPIMVRLEGHLTESALSEQLGAAQAQLEAGHRKMLVECLDMTDYDLEARNLFVRWSAGHRRQLTRMAIVTSRPLYHMVISAMSMASTVKMRPFNTVDDALAWLERPDP